jgi:hypothetical protein
LNANNKDFTSILPKNGVNIDFSGPVYLVTHDRIALGFALLNGVNVIYLAHNKDTFIFKNKYDKIISANSVPIEQSIHKQLFEFKNNQKSYSNFKQKYEVYTATRKAMIKNCNIEFNKDIDAANNFFDEPDILSEKENYKKNFIEILKKIKSIFMSALLYSYILQNLPDIEIKYNFVEQFLNSPKNEIYDESQRDDLFIAREYKNSIQSAFSKLGDIDTQIIDSSAFNIKTNLNIVLKKMAVYNAIDTLFLDITKKEKFVSRIKSMFSTQNQHEVFYEQYIFIKFITNLPSDTLRKIIDFFEQKFSPVVNTYKSNLESFYNGKRKGPDDQEKAMFLRPANLSSEVILILKPFIQTNDYEIPFEGKNIKITGTDENNREIILVDEIILNESTDVMVVNMDTEARQLDTNESGKSSDSFDEPDIMSIKEGGSLSKISEVNSSKKIGIVYDSNITQIIWDLMSFNICKSTYFTNIFKYIEENYKNQTDESVDDFSTLLNNQTQPGPKRGGTLQNILRDTSFCFHPLLPIYINLSSFHNQIGNELNGDPFYETYIQYVNVLEKMTNILIDTYLIDDLQKNLEGYLIGYSLKTVFFTANKSKKLFEKLKSLLGLTAHEMRMFCMKNDIFGGQIVGNYIVNENDREELIGILLLSIPVISKFLKEEVKMNNEINKPLNKTQIKLISNYKNRVYYTKNLKSHIESVLNKITNKINKDRTGKILETPMNSSTASTDSEKSGVPAPPSDKSKKQKNSIPTKEMENELYPTVFGFPKKPLAAHGGTKKHIKKPKINTKRTKRLRFIHKK